MSSAQPHQLGTYLNAYFTTNKSRPWARCEVALRRTRRRMQCHLSCVLTLAARAQPLRCTGLGAGGPRADLYFPRASEVNKRSRRMEEICIWGITRTGIKASSTTISETASKPSASLNRIHHPLRVFLSPHPTHLINDVLQVNRRPRPHLVRFRLDYWPYPPRCPAGSDCLLLLWRHRLHMPARLERRRWCSHQRLPGSSLLVWYLSCYPSLTRLHSQGYQCAYPGGACTWADKTGALQNTHQTNCPTVAACPASGCACPIDNNLDTGVLINQFKGYQCAYPGGACTWDNVSPFLTHEE